MAHCVRLDVVHHVLVVDGAQQSECLRCLNMSGYVPTERDFEKLLCVLPNFPSLLSIKAVPYFANVSAVTVYRESMAPRIAHFEDTNTVR
jgi:hypothetical protein